MDTTLPIDQDWKQYSNWESTHPVKFVLCEFIDGVISSKGEGIGMSPTTLTPQERAVLEQGRRRFASAGVQDVWGRALWDKWRRIGPPSLPKEPAAEGRLLRICSFVLGLEPGENESEVAVRQYLLAQFLSMHADRWPDPVKAILYAAAQAASHMVSRDCQDKSEVETSTLLTERLQANVIQAIRSVNKARSPLPPGSFLDFGSASMQGWRDLQGADFAIVVGTVVLGRPMFRVVLFQAKKGKSRGSADASHGDGSQLDELLSTGMGHYIFYPVTFHGKAFITTVRSAEDVFRDVWVSDNPPRFNVDTCAGSGEAAWDFAAFLAVAMTSPDDLACGRLFPDADAVAEALSVGRKKPLVSKVLAFDFTRVLNVHGLVQKLGLVGLDQTIVESAVSAIDDIRPEPDHPSADVSDDSFRP